jgi:hypothetical protein
VIFQDDKRQLPSQGPDYWAEHVSEGHRHYCKYCYRKTETFILVEGRVGSTVAEQHLRCCWDCGSGLTVLRGTVGP